MVHSIAMLHRDVHERIQQRVGKQMRPKTEIDELGMLRVVIMGLELHARIRQMIDLYLQSQSFRSTLHHLR